MVQVTKTATISDGKKQVVVAKEGHGLLSMTSFPEIVPDDICFEALKTSLDSAPPGVKVILNTADFYGPRGVGLELLARFFERYPEYVDKAFLSVKSGIKVPQMSPDASPENLKEAVDFILSKLRGIKKVDLFECARVDPNIPIEETIKVLSEYVEQGKFDFIGMSECAAETLKRGHKVHPIAAVEIEISPWSYEEETKRVIETAKELGIVVVGYSPLSRGLLSGANINVDTLHANDWRRRFTRFKAEAMEKNAASRERLTEIARGKGITLAQLCIAWVSELGEHVIPLPGSSKKSRTEENFAALNVTLSDNDLANIQKVIEELPVAGDRYFGLSERQMHLWG